MKKVLSLSVLLLSLSAEFAVAGFRMRGQTRPTQAPANTAGQQQQSQSDKGTTSTTLTTAQAVVDKAGVTLEDVAGALEDMSISASPAGSKGRIAAKQYIQTGSVTMPSSNKSHKLGRLGSKK